MEKEKQGQEGKRKWFTKQLMGWNRKTNDRAMPWKGIKNAYFIWLSEIILQQTRVEQGLPYYEKFTTAYPTVRDLANAPEEEVLKLWEGLGYYSRARNLHAAAKYIAEELNGVFPSTHSEILKLKGVGPYTAAAIASFAFDLPHAVLDGNVFRVLSRFFGIETFIDSTEGKKEFTKLADDLIDVKLPAAYNQAIMDFGATQCTPAKPLCMFCPLQENCVAYTTGKTAELPIKGKKMKRRNRYFYYLVIETEKGIYLNKRTQKDVWQDLYDFPLIESPTPIDSSSIKKAIKEEWLAEGFKIEGYSKPIKHLLTHQCIFGVFVKVKSIKNKVVFHEKKIKRLELTAHPTAFPLPKLMVLFFKNHLKSDFYKKN